MNIIWNNIKEIYKNFKIFIYIGIGILVLFLYFNVKLNTLEKKNEKLIDDIKIKNALLDSMHVYRNKYNEISYEKLTLQGKIKDLERNNDILTNNQKELINRIKQNDNIITAALIKMGVKIDSLLSEKNGIYNPSEQSINFEDSTKNISYDITIMNAKPIADSIKTKLLINNLFIPNKQYIEFKWKDNKKEGFPVAFSVSNSNIYFKTYDIDSYAIPELNKQDIKPNFWQKLNKFGNTNIGNGFKISIGIGIGYLLFHK